jgi:trans-aconitate methyltransferase
MPQEWDPRTYARDAAFVSVYGEELIALLNPMAGDKILDLGCGDGFLAEKLAKMGCDVTGVDSSQDQVAASKGRGINAFIGDGTSLGVLGEFDGVLSNAALHWMLEPKKVISNIWDNLKSGGVFVGEMGAKGNVAAVLRTLCTLLERRGFTAEHYNPWYFPSEEGYARMLAAQGFKIDKVFTFSRPTKLKGDLISWLRIFAQSFAAPIEPEEQDSFYSEAQAELEPYLYSPENGWVVDYVRLRFKVYRPKN